MRLQQSAELVSGAQELLRIDCFTVDPRLVMQMRPGRTPCRAEAADRLPDVNLLPDRHVDFREVTVSRRETVAVIDLDHLAVAAAPGGDSYGSGRGGVNLVAGVAAEVDAGVHRRGVNERIDAHAEA